MNRKERRKLQKDIKPVIKELHKLEKKYGIFKTRYAIRKHLFLEMAKEKRVRKIMQLEDEIGELKKGKIL